LVSVVIPVFNEEETVPVLVARLNEVLEAMEGDHEIIFVDDGSRDGSLSLLKEARADDERIKIVSFSRNFGHQVAISCGLDCASGDVVIAMDGDLQDPPEVVPELIRTWRAGYEVVYAVRRQRKENLLKRVAYKSFYWLLRKVSYLDIPLDSGDFSLMDRRIVSELRGMPERNRFVRGLRTWVGFEQTGYAYERSSRYAGESKYTLGRLMRLAFDGLISYSYVPLRLVSNIGMVVSVAALVYMAYLVIARFLGDTTIQGWVSTVAIVLFLGGVQLLSLGIIGEYIGRIFDEVKQRPQYVVREALGVDLCSERSGIMP